MVCTFHCGSLCGHWPYTWLDVVLTPDKLTPTDADVRAGERWVELLEQRKGLCCPPLLRGYLHRRDTNEPHLIALSDVDDRAHPASPYEGIRTEIEEAIAAGHWPTILDTRDSFRFGAKEHYTVQKNGVYEGGEFFPKTGWRKRPEVVRGPKREGGAKPIQLPTWSSDAVSTSESLRTVRLVSGSLWGESKPTAHRGFGCISGAGILSVTSRAGGPT